MKFLVKGMLFLVFIMYQTSMISLADSSDLKNNDEEVGLEQLLIKGKYTKDSELDKTDVLNTEAEKDGDNLIGNQSKPDKNQTTETIIMESNSTEDVVESKRLETQAKEELNTISAGQEGAIDVNGDGTEDNPYLVSNAEELKKHFEEGNSADQTIYIELIADIIYTDKNFMTAHSSIVLNGNNHSILYDGKNYATPHFSVDKLGAQITLKNLNYGNEEYPNSTNRGIMLVNAKNVNLNIENITYNITNGAQPFYAPPSGIYSILNFYGSNTFNLNDGKYSEEFSEGIDNINFTVKSITKIKTNSLEEFPFFRIRSNLNLTVQESANVEITSNKKLFLKNGNNNYINLASQSNFSVNFTNSESSIGTASNFTLDKEGLLDISYSGLGKGIDMKTTKIDVNDPNEIRLNSISTDNIIGLGTVELTNIDNQTYQLLSNSNNQWSQELLEGNSITLKNNKIKSYVYKPRITLNGVSTATDTYSDTSRIKTLITGIPEHMVLPPKYFADYLISEESYSTDGLINQLKVSEEFENSQDNHQNNSKVVSGNLSEVVEFNNLIGNKTYYVYARVRAFGEIDETTAWYEAEQLVPAYVEISLPKLISFSGTNIIKSTNDNLVFQNHGNIPMELNLDLVERSDKVALVDVINPKDTNELQLDLISDTFKWNFLVNSDSKTLRLEPFMKSGNERNISLLGKYSSPHHFINDVQYKIDVSATPVKGGDL